MCCKNCQKVKEIIELYEQLLIARAECFYELGYEQAKRKSKKDFKLALKSVLLRINEINAS